MSVVAGWGWRQRIRHHHWRHWWYLRLDNWYLECTRCGAMKPDKETLVTLSPFWKAVVAVVGAIAVAVIQIAGPEGTAGQVATIVVAVLTALGVYTAPNRTAT